MQREVFLEENRSKLSVNSESNIEVSLTGKQRLLPFDSAAETMSLYELYNMQRDNCEKYRLIFNINPFCTNVLFNAITEPVWREGSDSAISLVFSSVTVSDTNVFPNGTLNDTQTVDKKQAVKDTEYSHPVIGGIVYHCGYDIFNNHLLRTEDFLHAQFSDDNSTHKNFNTIEDYMVDNEGNVVEERGGRSFRHLGYVKRHMYQYDNCLSLPMAYLTKISEENGWYGFINTGYINIPNGDLKGKEISVNRVMNGNKPCEFYDMYPDRSLFSFIPKVNKWRKRLEKNWDYCITYPFECDFDRFNELNETPNIPDSDRQLNALKGLKIDLKYTNNGIKLIRIKTLFDHGLSKGSYVRFYYEGGDTPLTRHYRKIRVQQVGDYEGYDGNRYFSVAYDDVADIIKLKTETLEDGREIEALDLPDDFRLFVRQEANGSEFNYYLRKFKKIKYNDIEPRSEINKTAYQETIYGDRAVQIIYTDDIDVSGLLDNLGRPVTTLYLTVVKRNQGHDEWYRNENTTGEDIEFSHCFGKVTSGLDFGNDVLDYNIRKMHNIDGVDYDTSEMLGWVASSGLPKTIEDDITINGGVDDDEFYGDVACYDTYNLVEHVLMPIYHRFNTAQRELIGNDKFRDIISDDINSDDFDYGSGETITGTTEDETKQTPLITVIASPQNIPYHGTGNELKSIVTITSQPPLYEGTLKLRTLYPDINMTKTGENEYTVTFSENNTDSGRTVYVHGTLTTLPDTDYNGVFTETFDIPISQEEKEFPIGYEIVEVNIRDKVIQFNGQTTASVKINKVKYIRVGSEEADNIKEIITEDVDPTEEGISLTWSPENDQGKLGVEPDGKTAQCKNNNQETEDIDNVNLYVAIDGYTSSGAVYGIILKGEDEKQYTYKLIVTPAAATATTLNPATYMALLEKYESGATMPISTTLVNDTATWELLDDPDPVNDYARMVQNTVVKKEGIEPDGNIQGKVKCTCIDGNGEEISNEDDIFVTIVPDESERFTINFTNVATTQDTNITISVTQTGSTHSSESDGVQSRNVTITKGRNTVSEEFVFNKEQGESPTYKVQILTCTGNNSNVSYSNVSNVVCNWSQLNQQYLIGHWWTKEEMDGSTFVFDGLKSTIKIDTRDAGIEFESFGVKVDYAMSAITISANELRISNPFYVYDLGDTFTARIDGGVQEKDSMLYTIEIKNSVGTTLRSGTLESFRLGSGSNFGVEGMTPNTFMNTTWILGKGNALYSLVVCATTSETVDWNGTEQYRAFLIKTEGGQSTAPENVTTACNWYLTGDVKTNIAATILTSGPNGGKVTGRNNTPNAISGQVVAKYVDTETDPDNGIILTGVGNITVLGKSTQRTATTTLKSTAKVRLSLTDETLKGKTIDMTITSPRCDGSIGFRVPIPVNMSEGVVGITVLSDTMTYSTSSTTIERLPMNATYAIQSMSGIILKSTGPWSTNFPFEEEVSNSGDFSFNGYTTAGSTDYNLEIDGVFLMITNAANPEGGVYGAKSMLRAMNDDLLLGAGSSTGVVKEFSKYMLNDKDEGHFEVKTNKLNLVDGDGAVFYGNLNPEGYFYNPHTPIKIRQLSDEIYSVDGVIIGFDSGYVSTGSEVVETYDPDTQEIKSGVTVYTLSATSPVNMDFVEGMEFIIYNKENGDGTKVGRLLDFDDKFSGGGCLISLWVNVDSQAEIDELANGLKNKKYMLVLKKEYAPRYAIFQPKLRQFIWREVVPQSELRYDDELYDMTFANGRFYIHTNMNFYCRRQDPQNIYGLQSPETDKYNPLKKFRIGGREKVDMSDIIYSPDNLIDCF